MVAKKMPKNKRTSKKFASRSRPRPAKKGKLYDIPHFPQSEEFTSAGACAMMVLKYVNKNFKPKKDNEEEQAIWQDAVSGSVWHGSRHGLAYALAKRGVKPQIVSNVKDEGYERKLAVFEGINIDTLHAAFEEIKKKAKDMNIKESYGIASINSIKKHIDNGMIPIVIVDANALNPKQYTEPSPQWVVVKGYDKDLFYINDPYTDSTVSMEPEQFKEVLGFESEYNVVLVPSRKVSK
jgi:hypothetical protein